MKEPVQGGGCSALILLRQGCELPGNMLVAWQLTNMRQPEASDVGIVLGQGEGACPIYKIACLAPWERGAY